MAGHTIRSHSASGSYRGLVTEQDKPSAPRARRDIDRSRSLRQLPSSNVATVHGSWPREFWFCNKEVRRCSQPFPHSNPTLLPRSEDKGQRTHSHPDIHCAWALTPVAKPSRTERQAKKCLEYMVGMREREGQRQRGCTGRTAARVEPRISPAAVHTPSSITGSPALIKVPTGRAKVKELIGGCSLRRDYLHDASACQASPHKGFCISRETESVCSLERCRCASPRHRVPDCFVRTWEEEKRLCTSITRGEPLFGLSERLPVVVTVPSTVLHREDLLCSCIREIYSSEVFSHALSSIEIEHAITPSTFSEAHSQEPQGSNHFLVHLR